MPTRTAQQQRDAARDAFDAYLADCPSHKLLRRVSEKWVALVLKSLTDGPRRYSEVSRDVAGASQKMLTQTLRSLERDGMIERTITLSVPVRVDYELTVLGRSLNEALMVLKGWSERNMVAVEQARVAFDEGLESQPGASAVKPWRVCGTR